MKPPKINGALETVGAARARLIADVRALLWKHTVENEVGVSDCIAVLEELKLRIWCEMQNIRPEDEEDADG